MNLVDWVRNLEMRLQRLEAMVRGRKRIYADYYTTAGQSIPNNTETIVNFDTRVVDTHNSVTAGTAWAFVAAIAGPYTVEAQVLFASSTGWAAAEAVRPSVYVNGTIQKALERFPGIGFNGTAVLVGAGGAATVYTPEGGTIDVRVTQVSGTAMALNTSSFHNWVTVRFAG